MPVAGHQRGAGAGAEDEELRELAEAETAVLEPRLLQLEQQLLLALLPSAQDEGRNAILEVRGGRLGCTEMEAVACNEILRVLGQGREGCDKDSGRNVIMDVCRCGGEEAAPAIRIGQVEEWKEF